MITALPRINLWRCEKWDKTPLLVKCCTHRIQGTKTYTSAYSLWVRRYICYDCWYYYDYEIQECEAI